MQPVYGLGYTFHFYLFGVIAIVSAIVFVTRKSPVAAALWLVNTMFCLAALYVLLDAHFIGAIQVLVYAGAIMVVFLFVVMLLNLGNPSQIADTRSGWWKLGAGAIGLALISLLMANMRTQTPAALAMPPEFAQQELARAGAVGTVAGPLFAADGYLLAFELTSILLLVAIVGAVVIGKRTAARGGLDAG